MSLLSIAEIIELGDVSTYLSLKYQDEGKLFGAKLDGISPKSIAIVTDALRWYQESFPSIAGQQATSTITLNGTANPFNSVTFNIYDPEYGYITLGSYTAVGSESAAQLAAGIRNNLNLNPYGYTFVNNFNVITAYSRLDNAASFNGLSFSLTANPVNNVFYQNIGVSNFSDGISPYDNNDNQVSRKIANYLYWMCGKFQIEAQFIIQGVGGGIVSVLDPFATPNPLEFEVDGSSAVIDGGSSATFTQFIGYNILFMRNNIPQSTVNNGGSYFSWNKTTGQFSISPAAYTGELFQIYPFI